MCHGRGGVVTRRCATLFLRRFRHMATQNRAAMPPGDLAPGQHSRRFCVGREGAGPVRPQHLAIVREFRGAGNMKWNLDSRAAPAIVGTGETMRPWPLLLVLALAAGGCSGAGMRPWQTADMATGERQRVFEAAREVLARHFELAEVNFVKGVIETRPQVFEKSRSGTLADLRGAGGRWRRTAYFEMSPGATSVTAWIAVREEREATAAAEAIVGADERELPRVGPNYEKSASRPARQVWVEIRYDAGLARELLAAISDRVRQLDRDDRIPPDQSPKDAAEETRRLGNALNR